MDHIAVAVIILNWNKKHDTLECLRSVSNIRVPSGYRLDIIVVDNGSRDGSVSFLKQRFPDALYCEHATNAGYAGGNNIGITEALTRKCSFILILNNDVVVDPDLVAELLSAMSRDRTVGIAGAVNYYYARRNTIQFSGGHIEWSRGNIYDITRHRDDTGQFPRYRSVDTVAGSCMLIRREVIEKIGFMDERYFLNFEETDLCCRARRAGYRVVTCMKARLWHKVSLSFGRYAHTNMVDYFITRNKPLFLWKNSPRSYVPLSLAYHLFDTVIKGLRYAAHGRYDCVVTLCIGIRDALLGRYYGGSMTPLVKADRSNDE
jgi:GT2 family glycosyltransferase